MPFDGSGTFNRDRTWSAEAAAGTKIRADNHDTHDTDLANGLSQCITKNGSSQPTANIPMNSKRIINMADPSQAQDAATKGYVDNFRDFSTSIKITGADANGQILFTSPTGSNGLSWASSGVDMSFVGRVAKASETTKRLVINNKMDASTNLGGDVFRVDERGHIGNNGQLSTNLSYDGAKWRTISPGYGALMNYYSGGDFNLSSNDIASITNPYVEVALRTFFQAKNDVGNAILVLNKSLPIQSANKACQIWGKRNSQERWLIQLGDTAAETATERVGSDFSIYGYNNGATANYRALHVSRQTLKATFGGEVNTPSTFSTATTTAILAAANGGAIYLRPNGAGSTVEQVYIDTAGDLHTSTDIHVGEAGPTAFGSYLGAGMRGKSGSGGAYVAHWHNQYWDGTNVRFYVNTSFAGIPTQPCDYRIKENIQPMQSTWEAIKRLNPVRYTQKAYDIWVEDPTPKWGFLAHDLQEALLPTAATGEKDGADIQVPNVMAVLAATVKALQEAMARIEVLEARP